MASSTTTPNTAAILSGLAKVRVNEGTTDFTLQTSSGEKTYEVHKLVLLIHSDTLYRMATSPHFIECQNQTITFKEVDDSCVEALVDFLYGEMRSHTDYFPISPTTGNLPNKEDIKGSVNYFAGLWRLADMYDMPILTQSVIEGFEKDFMYILKDMDFLEWELDAAAEVEQFPEPMWGIMVECCVRKFMGPHGYDKEDTTRVFEKHPKFAVEVLQGIVGGIGGRGLW